MAKLIGLEARSETLPSKESPEPLRCERCTAQLLIAAWRAVAAAGKTIEASAFTEDGKMSFVCLLVASNY